ncbi:MAG: alpha-hydroxy-acid oxidizing protein [Actinomycetota bacterium]|nr:alpha-hydroxy-acid oxidizing protein [Actinomycetota bacterium]
MGDEQRFVTVDDYEPVARERLSRDVYDYLAGGAGDEWTLAENRRAFERWVLRPRFLRGGGAVDPSTVVLGQEIAMPILLAPWAFQRIAHPDGELATARAAAAAGTIMAVSTTALDILEDVAAAAGGSAWWQLYLFEDRGASVDVVDRVVAAGYRALCWTVDFPVNGLRHRDTRNGFELPMGLSSSSFVFDADITWDDVGWIRDHAPGLPILVKGILTAEDAALALEAGVDGIVVSNHGGRQLDTSMAGIDALPEVVDTVGGRVPVLMDGGVRRGVDVMKALALGATAVMVGRPAAWGLAAHGEEGVAGVLEILRGELVNAMSLAGCGTIEDITRAHVAPAPGR